MHPRSGVMLAALLPLLALPARAVLAQDEGVDIRPANGAKTTQASQIRTCRDGVLDSAARPEDRRRWIDLLLSYDSAESRALVVEFLRPPTKPEIQKAVCDALRDSTGAEDNKLDAGYMDSLVDLLDADAAVVRSAAARTLAAYRTPAVSARLGSIAADAGINTNKRLAAIDALAPNIHRREVVQQLVPLLESDAPEIVARVSATLEPAFFGTVSMAPSERAAWLRQRLAVPAEVWLDEQLETYHDRALRLQNELAAFREETKREQAALVTQVGTLQRELYRSSPSEQRPGRLLDWLGSTLPATQLNALGIIKAAIADEGRRPEGDVLSSVLRLLASPSPAVRRETLSIVQALNDPVVVDAVLARVDSESDVGVRQALFAAIGKLETPQAIPALLREITDLRTPTESAREAALALGQIAGGVAGAAVRHDCVAPLKLRYRGLSASDQPLRAALLSAMARVADPAFTQEFLEAVESDDAAILQPAIQGLRATREASKLARLRVLIGHADPSVRLAAIEAVSDLGREELDLETLRLRLNPGVESSALVREAAGKAFRDIVSRRPLAEQIRAADRLRDTPDLAIRYLEDLLGSIENANSNPADVLLVRDRLATYLLSAQRFAQSAPHLRRLFESRANTSAGGALEYGLRWLDALLHSAPPKEVVDAVMQIRGAASDRAVQTAIVDAFTRYADSPAFLSDPNRARSLCDALRSGCGEDWIPTWSAALARASARFESTETPQTGPSD